MSATEHPALSSSYTPSVTATADNVPMSFPNQWNASPYARLFPDLYNLAYYAGLIDRFALASRGLLANSMTAKPIDSGLRDVSVDEPLFASSSIA